MRNVNNSVDTVNAAASAIVSAESRTQPSSIQKKKWSMYCCFGSQKKSNKRIGHAALVPEPVLSGPVHVSQSQNTISTSMFIPFIAPPSSPASSFLQSYPSSVSHTPPTGLVSCTTRNEPSSSSSPSSLAFETGPYANETQLVTPPVCSAFTTEPSTAPFTPPLETLTPSSPEVPFAQLLTSSLEKARRNNCGVSHKFFSAAHYEFKSNNQVCPESPNLISPGSVISNSGTSSPYQPAAGKCSIIEFRIGEPPKFLGFEHFTAQMVSKVLESGSLLDSQISEVASLADSDHCSSRHDGEVNHHRVSFELTGEDVARCFESKLNRAGLDDQTDASEAVLERDQSQKSLRSSVSLGSSKEFKFNSTKEEMVEKATVRSEWWTNENMGPGNKWSFFPVLRSGFN
ncbi:unnamed protein product [Cochlearia groenlandica]